MSPYLEAVLVAAAVGAGGTAAGACGAIAVHRPGRNLTSILLGLAGGIILALAVLDMIPEAYELGGPLPFWIGFAAGICILALLTGRAHEHHAHEASEQEAKEIAKRSLLRTGFLLAAGMAVHNLPQGIAIGSGIEADYIVGMAMLLFAHNIPEGMAMAIPLRIGGVQPRRIYGIALLTAVPTIAGAVAGVALSSISDAFISGCMAFAASAMLYLTVRELIPRSAALGRTRHVIAAVSGGFLAGCLLMLIIE